MEKINFTFVRKVCLSSALFVSAGFAIAQTTLYDNGPVFNSIGTGAAGANESVLQTTTLGMGTIGFGAQQVAFNRIADDFAINDCQWQIDSIVFFAYQTNSGNTSTINSVNFRIWDSIPDALGSTLVYGDTTTNRLTSTAWSGVYRITETTVGNTARPIMRNVCAVAGLTLTTGNYWIDWSFAGTSASGPWAPPIVILNTAVTGNAKQRISLTWNNAVDGGTGTPAQGFPFIIYGSVPSSFTTQTFVECSGFSVTVGSNTYDTTGVYTDVLTNAAGCDSTVTTNLTIKQPTYSSQTFTECAGFSVTVGTNTYTTTGVYTDVLTNAVGCDSIVTTNLTIKQPTFSSQTFTECAGFSVTVGTNTYTTTGVYTDVLTNAVGCDSTVTTNLKINQPTSASQTFTECTGFSVTVGTNTYTSTGVYTDVLTNAAGCDSTVTTNLTINKVSDLTTTSTGLMITANNTGATYQWLNCDQNNAAIANATGQSFTPTANGSYAVELTENGCVDTSACVAITSVGILANSFGNELVVYPNPTNGTFSIDLGTVYESPQISIRDAAGKLITTENVPHSQVLTLSFEAPAGIYILSIQAGGKNAVLRLVKQ